MASKRPVRITATDLLPGTRLILFLRWWLPVLVVVSGVVVMAASGFDEIGLEGGAGFIGAGLSIALMNFMWRIGISGDADREEEDQARLYFDRCGHWPDEQP